MRRKGISPSYFILGLFLFCWVSLPRHYADRMRCYSVASFAPAWGWVKEIKQYLSDRPSRLWVEKKETDKELLSQLELENAMLRLSVEKMSKWLSDEERQSKKWENQKKDFFERRANRLISLIQSELMAMPAQVIYRDPTSWSSSLWINVGEEDNRVLGHPVIAKNSPVVSGSSLVGVVDYVGKNQSRVRLITDSGLSPAVRCVRGSGQNREIASLVGSLIDRLEYRSGKDSLIGDLHSLKNELEAGKEERYLAKGELHGSGSPLWRARSTDLKGIGFNFDYADEEGSSPKGIPILEKGDLLVTTGFDGVFPSDLQVGIVTSVTPPKSGGYAYEINVRPIVSNLNDIEDLFVLPSRSD
jgi:rod shape-determining protein MreC